MIGKLYVGLVENLPVSLKINVTWGESAKGGLIVLALHRLTCCQQSVNGLINELAPGVDAQVEAIEQEKARLNKSLDYVREELEKVDVSGELKENLEGAHKALERAKAQVRV